MDIAFRARNIEVPDPLRSRTVERVSRLGGVVALERAYVCFSEERNPRIAERVVCGITLYGGGRLLRAQATATDPAVAADRVVEKLRHRVERVGGRLSRRVADRHGSVHFGAHRHMAACDPDLPVDRRSGDAKNVKTQARTEAMTPEEAALEMALLSYDFYFFINTETARGAVVYRRVDGNVGLLSAANAGT